MKLILALLLFISTSALASPTFYDEPDKVLHTQWSAIGAHVLYGVGASEDEAFWAMMAIGALNEAQPHNTGRERRRDMIANLVGAGTVYVKWGWIWGR